MYFLKSLETDNLYTIKGAYDFLSKIEEEQNKYTDAIYYNKQYRIYSDSIYVLTHTYDLAELQARYDHERLLNIANSLQITNFKNSFVVNYLFANNHFILSEIYTQKGKIVGFYKRKNKCV